MDEQSPPWIATGDQPEWNGSTPDAWRALAQGDFAYLPSIARLSPDELMLNDLNRTFHLRNHEITQRCASIALQVLMFRLGWRSIGVGIREARNREVSDIGLSLVEHLLGPYEAHLAQFANDCGYLPFLMQDSEIREVSEERNVFFNGGGDPLHLSRHCVAPVEDGHYESRPGVMHLTGNDQATGFPRAIVEIDQYASWYSELDRLGNFVGRANGSVDVYCKPVGWLGTYKLSQRTSVWHATTEEIHLLGFPRNYSSSEPERWPQY